MLLLLFDSNQISSDVQELERQPSRLLNPRGETEAELFSAATQLQEELQLNVGKNKKNNTWNGKVLHYRRDKNNCPSWTSILDDAAKSQVTSTGKLSRYLHVMVMFNTNVSFNCRSVIGRELWAPAWISTGCKYNLHSMFPHSLLQIPLLLCHPSLLLNILNIIF